jgi:hypothetical protein
MEGLATERAMIGGGGGAAAPAAPPLSTPLARVYTQFAWHSSFMNHVITVSSTFLINNLQVYPCGTGDFFRVFCRSGGGEARGFKVGGGGVRGRVREGVYPLPLGARGLRSRKIFQITDACRRVLAHFSD